MTNFEKAIAQVKNKQLRLAIKSFTLCIENNEKVLESYLHRSSCYFQLKEFENVVEDLTKAIDFDPTWEEYYYNRAAAYVNLTQYQNALDDYNIAVTLNPQYKNAHYNKGSVHMKLDQHEKAVESFLEAGALGHEDALIVLKHYLKRGVEINENSSKEEPEIITQKMAKEFLRTLKLKKNKNTDKN